MSLACSLDPARRLFFYLNLSFFGFVFAIAFKLRMMLEEPGLVSGSRSCDRDGSLFSLIYLGTDCVAPFNSRLAVL